MPLDSCRQRCDACGPLGAFQEGVGRRNPILAQTLGICSALAVTGTLDTTFVMCAALLFVSGASTFLVSLMRNVTPHRIRLIVQMLVISVMVILVHQYLRAFHNEMSRALGPYVGLIITNCILLGRCEAFAMSNGPLRSLMDGLGSAAGYGLVLVAVALIREPLGHGTLLNARIMPEWFRPALLLSAAPGAFLAMGTIVWVVRAIRPRSDETTHPEVCA